MADKPWVKKLRKLHGEMFEIEGGWAEHVRALNETHGLRGDYELATVPLPELPPTWFLGNVEEIEPRKWILAFALNPKKDTDVDWWKRRRPWDAKSKWQYQLEGVQHSWNRVFHANLARLASGVMGMQLETQEALRAFAAERMVFMEVCPYMSKRWSMEWDTLQTLCSADVGFKTEEDMVRTLVSEAQPLMILVNGMSAVWNFEKVYANQMEWKEESYPSDSKPDKMLRHWEGTFTAGGSQVPVFGFPFLRSIGGHNSKVEQTQLAGYLS